MERERPTPEQALQTRVDFLEAAIKDGAHHFVDVRRINIVGVLNGSPATGADLGRQYKKPITRERIRKLHNEGMGILHRHSSPQTQGIFPLRSILGIDKPHYDRIKEKVEKEEDWNKLQEILDSLSGGSIQGYINHHRQKGQSLFAYLGVVVRKAGLHYAPKDIGLFYETLESLEIPGKKIETGRWIRGAGDKLYPQCYYVTYAKHREIIVEAFKAFLQKKLG